MKFGNHIIILHRKVNVTWKPHNDTASEGKRNFVHYIIIRHRKVKVIWRPHNYTASVGKCNLETT